MSTEDYFNSSRLKVIGLITAATLTVGALGGIAGAVFDPEPASGTDVVQPGADDRLAPRSLGDLGGPGRSVARAGRVGTTAGDVGADGTAVTMAATGVQASVPPGWHVDDANDSQVFQSDGHGSFSFAFTFADDPSTAAGDIITGNLESLLPSESYTQLELSDVVPLEPRGAVVSIAAVDYDALWVDNQGSASIHGQAYVAVRQDGTVLGILIEHVPTEDFEAAFDGLVPILDLSYGVFAGIS